MSKVGESVKHVTGSYKLRARPAEFSAMGEYLDTFGQKLGTIDRIAQRILKEQSGIRSHCAHLLPHIVSVRWCKTGLSPDFYLLHTNQ